MICLPYLIILFLIVCGWFWKEPVICAEMRIQTWKWTLTADALSYHYWLPRRQSRLHLSSRRCPSSHGAFHTGLAVSELSWVHWKESVAPNSPNLNPPDYVTVARLEKYHKLQLKPKMIDELKVANYLRRAATRTHQRTSPSTWLTR